MRESDGVHRAGDVLGTLVPVHRPQQPERRLQLAVLERAMEDWNLFRDQPGYTAHHERGLLRQWFAADDEGRPHAFMAICDSFGLNAEAFRERIFRGEPVYVGMIRHPGKAAQPSAKRSCAAGAEWTVE